MAERSKSQHRVGIGLAVFNGEEYLEGTVRSILAQTYDDFELIISDNASTDRTAEICKDFAASDPRITYLRNAVNLGASKNYACCFHPTRAEYFRWASADDLLAPNSLELCVKTLDTHPDAVLAYGKTYLIDGEGALIKPYEDNMNLQQERASDRYKQFHEVIGFANVFYGLIRRKALANTALLANYRSSDINLIAELTLYGKFVEIPEYLFYRRIHPEAISSSVSTANEEKLRSFWDPSKRRLVMQTWRSQYEYFKAAFRAPIPVGEKLTVAGYLAHKTVWNRKRMASELADLIRHMVVRG